MSLESWRDFWWRHKARNHGYLGDHKARISDEITQGVSTGKEEDQGLSPGVPQH